MLSDDGDGDDDEENSSQKPRQGKFGKSKTKTEQKLHKLHILVQTLRLTLSESGRVVKLDEKF